MGAGQSTGGGGGYRVLSVHPSSPASDVLIFPTPESAAAGVREPQRGSLVAFFDIIVSANGVSLDHEGDEFANEIRSNIGKPVLLAVYNTKARTERPVQVVPRADWGGEGLLGMHVKFDPIETPQDSALHVTEVAPASPAARAGLVAEVDYIVGFPGGTFENAGAATSPATLFRLSTLQPVSALPPPCLAADTFGDFLAGNDGGSATLFVLRAATDSVRAVTLDLSAVAAAGGVGLTVAQGHLHQMPNAGLTGVNEWSVQAAAAAAPGSVGSEPVVAAAAAVPQVLLPPPSSMPAASAVVLATGAAAAGAPPQPGSASAAVAAAAFSAPPVHGGGAPVAVRATGGAAAQAQTEQQQQQQPPRGAPPPLFQQQPAPRSHHLLQPVSYASQQQQQEFAPADAMPPSVSVELPAPAAPPRSSGWFR